MAQAEPTRDSMRIVVDLTMSVEEARRTPWQVSPHKPIGEMLNCNEITYRDLAWAVKAAYDPRVRAASQTLLAYWIGQPTTLEATKQYGPKVVAGSTYLEESEADRLMGYAAWSLATCVMIVVVLFNFAQQFVFTTKEIQPIFPIGNAAISIGTIAVLFRKAQRNFVEYRDHRRGRKGEEAIVERLRVVFDSHWTIFRNLHLPGHRDDLDLVLVGPGGVWTLEVKAFRGTLRVQGNTWERQDKNRWRKLDSNPTAQVRRNAQQLNDFLKRQGIPIRWVEPAVALAEPQPVTNFDSSEIPIWLLPTIEEQSAKLTTRTPPTQQDIERIAAVLEKRAEEQLAVEKARK